MEPKGQLTMTIQTALHRAPLVNDILSPPTCGWTGTRWHRRRVVEDWLPQFKTYTWCLTVSWASKPFPVPISNGERKGRMHKKYRFTVFKRLSKISILQMSSLVVHTQLPSAKHLTDQTQP